MNNTADFFPEGYSVPDPSSRFLKLEQGKNKLRILDRPVFGWVWWEEHEDGTKTVHRSPYSDKRPAGKGVKHFWLVPVWNYQTGIVQVWEIGQITLQRSIEAIVRDEDWGNPSGYDLVIRRKGTGMDTEYNVVPSPKSKLDKEIAAAYEEERDSLAEEFAALFGDAEEEEEESIPTDDDELDEEDEEEEEEKKPALKKKAARKKVWEQ